MELRILKNISNDDLEFFTKFLEKNLHLKEVIIEYEKISYLDDINKFFFLFKNRESLRNSNYDFFLYYKEKKQSILHLFFALSNPRDFDKLRFRLSSEEDATLFVDLFLQIEIYRTLENIAQRNALFTKKQKKKRAFLVNNFSLLQVSPFIFHKEELVELIEEEIKKFPEENIFNLNFENDSLDLVYSSISERTNLDYVKLFSYNYNRYLIYLFELNTEEKLVLEKLNKNPSEQEIDFSFTFATKYQFNYSNYKEFDFMMSQLRDYTLRLYTKSNSDYEIDEKIEIQNIKNSLEVFSLNKKLRGTLKLNVPTKKVVLLFNSYCEQVLKNKSLKIAFKDLILFLDSTIDHFPKTDELSINEIKQLIRFFSRFKDEVFTYEVKSLIFLMLSFANKLEETDNTSIERAHRDSKFDLDKETFKSLNSIIR